MMTETDAINAPPGEVEARLNVEVARLRSFKEFAHAHSTLARSEDADLLVLSLTVSIALASRIRNQHMTVRAKAHHAAVAAQNDERGIPNCDHLIPKPDCPECMKGTV